MRNTIFGRYIRQQREKIGWPTNQQRTERRQRSSSQLQRRRRGGVVFRIFHPSFVPLPHHRPFFHLLGPRSFLSPAPAPECLATKRQIQGLVSWLINFFLPSLLLSIFPPIITFGSFSNRFFTHFSQDKTLVPQTLTEDYYSLQKNTTHTKQRAVQFGIYPPLDGAVLLCL